MTLVFFYIFINLFWLLFLIQWTTCFVLQNDTKTQNFKDSHIVNQYFSIWLICWKNNNSKNELPSRYKIFSQWNLIKFAIKASLEHQQWRNITMHWMVIHDDDGWGPNKKSISKNFRVDLKLKWEIVQVVYNIHDNLSVNGIDYIFLPQHRPSYSHRKVLGFQFFTLSLIILIKLNFSVSSLFIKKSLRAIEKIIGMWMWKGWEKDFGANIDTKFFSVHKEEFFYFFLSWKILWEY